MMRQTPTRAALHLALLLALTAAVGACDKPVDLDGSAGTHEVEPTEPLDPTTTLALEVVERDGDVAVVELRYQPPEGVEGPRTAEVWLQHSAGLVYESAEAGDSVSAAGKRLIVQARKEGQVRTVVFGTADLSRMGAGALARYRFRVLDDDDATVEVLERLPLFAPSEANQGLHLPGPLVVGGD